MSPVYSGTYVSGCTERCCNWYDARRLTIAREERELAVVLLPDAAHHDEIARVVERTG
jgi:hypothetical protein